ncbi:MAG: gamma-glutamyltransferase [Pseudomonadota bacterium]
MRISRTGVISSLLVALLVQTNFAFAQQAADAVQPEDQVGAVDRSSASPVIGKDWMVSTANPHASEAGAAVLRNGGNAIDAMVAVQTTLGLTEPQSSGLGGGAFLMYWDNSAKRLVNFDARETAPLDVKPTHFLNEDGKPLRFFDAVVSGMSVGVPGMPKLLWEVHQKYGKSEWAPLLSHARQLAEDGFEISPRLAGLIAGRVETLGQFQKSRDYFLTPDGNGKPQGTLLKNPEYAETLALFQKEGADVFYTGEIAQKIVDAVQSAEIKPGPLSMTDMAIYEIREREPVCVVYRGLNVCGAGPPTSGGIAVGQILGILENFDIAALGPNTLESLQMIGDATRLAFADRARYVADIDFVAVPVKGLVRRDYLKRRARLLEVGKKLEDAPAGEPLFDHALNFADDPSREIPSTTHFVIRDSFGNVVSMTASIESAFGSNLMAGGFLLNNQLTDFSFITHIDNLPVANAIAPGKRPRSSMSPTIVMKGGEPYIAIGSPGGSRIIPYVAKAIIALVDWDMNIQEAINLPHFANRFGAFALEDSTAAVALDAPLRALGYDTVTVPLNSGLHGLVIEDEQLEGGADPRREGVVIAE